MFRPVRGRRTPAATPRPLPSSSPHTEQLRNPKPTLTPLSSSGYLRRRLRGRISAPQTGVLGNSLMRAKAGDPPRTMPQKILAGRADDPLLAGDLVHLKVDQVILSREPHLAVAVAYDTPCVTAANDEEPLGLRSALNYGMLVARPGIGFPAAVHLERFAAPARLAITDDPRMAAVGGAGMLTIVASPSQIGEVLATGAVWLRPPRSVQVLLSGRVRPFVCVRDAALELLRRGLGEVIERVDRQHDAPVVLEFAGPSARLL